jgi:oligopeptidase B
MKRNLLRLNKNNTFIYALLLIILIAFPTLPRSAEYDNNNIVPPVAKIIPQIDTLHGDIRVDNYYWLKDKADPEVVAYLEAENKYTKSIMKHTEAFQEKLYQEMLARIKETDLTVPEKLDDYFYYRRTEEGKQYPIYCRKKDSPGAAEEIILDQNILAEGYNYFDIGVLRVSPDHRLLAYTIDTAGSERFTLFIKNIEKDKLFDERISNLGYSVAWATDNKTIFYTTLDKTKRAYKLYRHKLGTDPERDTLVYHEKDEAFFIGVSLTKSKRFLILDTGSHTTSEEYFLDAKTPEDEFTLIKPRQHEVEYYVDHHDDKFFILTNENAKNFKLMITPVKRFSEENWKEIIPHRDSVKIESIDVFKNHLVLYERENGLETICIHNFATQKIHYVDFPEPVYTFWCHSNRDFNTNLLRFTYTSLITPRSVFDYNMNTKIRELKKQYEVLGGYEPSIYQSERIFAKTKDSTMVPISLVYKKGMVKDGENNLLLTGYGAYGGSFDPYFSSNRLSLLDRGFIYAIAHVRGGGEMGRYWYDQGKLLNKKNTFTDFIACAEHLINEKYTSSSHLGINGGSAGGLLIGAVINMRPELFKIAVADVPFVDLINTMFDPSLPLTVLEYEEWGNPEDKEYYNYMKSYSPYDNVKPIDYPNILITAGLNDTRVMYWEAAKWTAKLRALKTDNDLLLLKMNMGTGHLGASGRYDYLKDIAFEFAFIFKVLGISENYPNLRKPDTQE